MTKGRPPLAPRIEALERELVELKRQIAALNDSFAQRTLPSPSPYRPLFERWPGSSV